MYRRQHEKALAKIVDKIADAILAEEKRLNDELDEVKKKPETLEKLAAIQDFSSQRYALMKMRRQVKQILRDSRNLLVATIVERLEN